MFDIGCVVGAKRRLVSWGPCVVSQKRCVLPKTLLTFSKALRSFVEALRSFAETLPTSGETLRAGIPTILLTKKPCTIEFNIQSHTAIPYFSATKLR